MSKLVIALAVVSFVAVVWASGDHEDKYDYKWGTKISGHYHDKKHKGHAEAYGKVHVKGEDSHKKAEPVIVHVEKKKKKHHHDDDGGDDGGDEGGDDDEGDD